MPAMKRMLLVVWAVAAFAAAANAQNIDLTTVPGRDEVQLTIYNSEDLTLVKERRSLTFRKGLNRVQFSWANTLIDPTSLEIRILTNTDKIDVLDTSYPPNRPQVLVWNIESQVDGQQDVEIRYFISGLTWSADYTAISDAGESRLSLEGFVRVYNSSGEEFTNAKVRLVVGVINLVEKIRDLAGGVLPRPEDPRYKDLERRAREEMFDKAEAAAQSEPKKIVKEGLSEYFIYTIEGSETIPNGWSRRMRSFFGDEIPFEIEYRLREHEYGAQPVRFFKFKNDKEHHLGETPLPDGVLRTFRQNGRDGLFYLGQQAQKYISIGAEVEINLGSDPEVIFERRIAEYRKENLVFHNNHVVGWDDVTTVELKFSNYTAKEIEMEFRQAYDGDVEFTGEGFRSWDYRTVERRFGIRSRQRETLKVTVRVRQGTRAQQSRVVVK